MFSVRHHALSLEILLAISWGPKQIPLWVESWTESNASWRPWRCASKDPLEELLEHVVKLAKQSSNKFKWMNSIRMFSPLTCFQVGLNVAAMPEEAVQLAVWHSSGIALTKKLFHRGLRTKPLCPHEQWKIPEEACGPKCTCYMK